MIVAKTVAGAGCGEGAKSGPLIIPCPEQYNMLPFLALILDCGEHRGRSRTRRATKSGPFIYSNPSMMSTCAASTCSRGAGGNVGCFPLSKLIMLALRMPAFSRFSVVPYVLGGRVGVGRAR